MMPNKEQAELMSTDSSMIESKWLSTSKPLGKLLYMLIYRTNSGDQNSRIKSGGVAANGFTVFVERSVVTNYVGTVG